MNDEKYERAKKRVEELKKVLCKFGYLHCDKRYSYHHKSCHQSWELMVLLGNYFLGSRNFASCLKSLCS